MTPAMTAPPVGKTSVHASTAQDVNGGCLDGGKTYSVTLPGPVPAANFWSFIAQNGQTRSFLGTDQKSVGVDSKRSDLNANDDGSYTVWFGPLTSNMRRLLTLCVPHANSLNPSSALRS